MDDVQDVYFSFEVKDQQFILDPSSQIIWTTNESRSEILENKVQLLEKYAFFQEKEDQKIKIPTNSLQQLVINPSSRCTLNCWYCYVNNFRKTNSQDLPLSKIKEILSNAIELKERRNDRTPLSISLYLSSEITEDFQKFAEITEYLNNLRLNTGIDIYLLLPPTNLMNPDSDFIDFIDKYGFLTVSLDYDRKEHLITVLNNLKKISNDVIKHCFAPFHSEIKDIFLIYTFLMKEFDLVSLRPVRISLNTKFPWTFNSIQKYNYEFSKFIDELLKLEKADLLKFLLSLGPSDFFVRSINRIISREKYHTRCLAGINAVTIAPDGYIYPCSGLMGSAKDQILSLDDLYDVDKNSLFNEKSIFGKDECNMCPIRYYCGGPCEDWKGKQLISKQKSTNPIECSLNFLFLKKCIFLISEIINRYPDLLIKYAKEKGIEYRLNYPLDFNKFVLFFS